MKSCPFCAEQIQDAAQICRYCNRPVASDSGLSNVVNHPIQHRVTLKRGKLGIMGCTSILLGSFGLFLSVVLGLTLVGLPFAILMGIGSIGFITLGMGGAKFNCPYCGKSNIVSKITESLRCPKCRNLTIIDWTK
jgi:predicted RNA-binding Zn-ribbon protein involved in translation (DUF1610 family)